MASKLDFALQHAERGWRVIPLHNPVPERGCSCRKKGECPSIGKHPRIDDWTTKATTDPHTIRGWWKRWPDANIGLATGSTSGFFALDVDDKDNGQGSATLSCLEEMYGELPLTPVVQTGTGRHYYFASPGFALNNRVGKAGVGAGLDIRADGGLVVAAGSVHATGAEYEWLIAPDVPLATAPQWLIDRIQGGSSSVFSDAPVEVAPTSGSLALIPEGERNTGLFLAASSMRGRGMEQDEIENRLLEINAIQCATPLPVEEVKTIAKSVTRYVAGKRPAATIGVLKGKDRLVWMKVFPADILGDAWLSIMPDYQFGWRMRLTLEAWRRGGILPSDKRALAMLARATSFEQFVQEMDCVLYDFDPVELDGEPMLLNREIAELFAGQMIVYKQKCEASARAQAAREANKRREEAENGGQRK